MFDETLIVEFSYTSSSATSGDYTVTIDDFSSSYSINIGERETLDTYLDNDQVIERDGPCAATTTIISYSDPTIAASPFWVCKDATGVVEVPFTLPTLENPTCDDTENFWMPVLRPISSTMTNK